MKEKSRNFEVSTATIINAFMLFRLQENIEVVSEDADKTTVDILKKIDNQIYLHQNFKNEISKEIYEVVAVAANDAFDMGLNLGLSLLSYIINAEIPEFKVRPELRKKLKPMPNIGKDKVFNSEDDSKLYTYIRSRLEFLTDIQKGKLQSYITSMVNGQR